MTSVANMSEAARIGIMGSVMLLWMSAIAGLEFVGSYMADDLGGWWILPGVCALLVALVLCLAGIAAGVYVIWVLVSA